MNCSSKTSKTPEPWTHDYTLWMMKTGTHDHSAEQNNHDHHNNDLNYECDCSANDTGLIPVAGTYDTFKCVDCEIVLSGYMMADKNLNKHVLRNAATGKRCRYIKDKFKHREVELRLLEGLLQFQEAHVAFPAHVLLAKKQYRIIQGNWHCVLCSQRQGKSHYPACADVMDTVKQYIEDTKLISRPAGPLLFNSAVARTVKFGWLECDSTATGGACAEPELDFAVLGDKENMTFVPGTRDKHHCKACGLFLHDFVEGDTLLGEHIYYTYNNGGRCTYIDGKYTREEILYKLGLERFRRGMVAFPTRIFEAEHGYSSVAGLNRCIVCAAATARDRCLPAREHKIGCAAVTDALANKLKRVTIPLS